MSTINWGIIGCGDVCERKSGPAFRKIDGSHLLAVMRRDAIAAQSFAQRHNISFWYNEADGILCNPDINAIYIATPPSSHKEYAIKAMEAGKAVYVEKPMACSYAECLEMIEKSKETKMPLFVAHYRRALPYFLKVKNLIENEAIGKPLHVSIRYFRAPSSVDVCKSIQPWRVKKEIAGAGYFYDMAPHSIDIVEYIIDEIVDVKGNFSGLGGYYDVEDTISASFRFKNGALGSAAWCFVASPESKTDVIEIVGAKGRITFSTFEFTPIVLETDRGREEFAFRGPEHIQQPFIQTIVDELQGVGICACHGEDGAKAVWFMDKVLGRVK